jgi:hypothetical protein
MHIITATYITLVLAEGHQIIIRHAQLLISKEGNPELTADRKSAPYLALDVTLPILSGTCNRNMDAVILLICRIFGGESHS